MGHTDKMMHMQSLMRCKAALKRALQEVEDMRNAIEYHELKIKRIEEVDR